jgi:hypothetical protein
MLEVVALCINPGHPGIEPFFRQRTNAKNTNLLFFVPFVGYPFHQPKDLRNKLHRPVSTPIAWWIRITIPERSLVLKGWRPCSLPIAKREWEKILVAVEAAVQTYRDGVEAGDDATMVALWVVADYAVRS